MKVIFFLTRYRINHTVLELKALSKNEVSLFGFFGFIGVICLNSLLQYLCGVDTVKEIPLNGAIEYIDTFMLTMAMTALGTDTGIEKFKAAGAKPFILALMLFAWLVGGGYLLAKYLAPVIMQPKQRATLIRQPSSRAS